MSEEIKGEIVDERTGEIIPKGEINTHAPANNILQTQLNIHLIGTLELSPETEKVLAEPLDEKDVKIRPDGLVYLPWTFYEGRLNRAFGRLRWGLVPQGAPQSKDTGNNNVLVVWGFWLVIKGIPVGFSMGETSYRTNNNTMSWGDAMEGAKSISLARNCKVLGMASEMWDAQWCAEWKKKYAETYKDEKTGKTLWRKKGAKKEQPKNPAPADSIDEHYPPVPEGDKSYSTKDILKSMALVKEISTSSGKKNSEVAVFVGKLEKDKTYTVVQVVEMMKEEK